MNTRGERNQFWYDIESILEAHGVPKNEDWALKQGDRPKEEIDAIITDLKAMNSGNGFRLLDYV